MDLNNCHIKLQALLMLKDDAYGKLKFLTSRTTEENSKNVQDVCDSVADILRSFKIPMGDAASIEDAQCIDTFKYFVLNTDFDCQKDLSDDLLHYHLVDICPPLSPYLLMEIFWSLGYEKILAESILHVPLDLTIAIIEIARRCLHLLNFERGFELLALLTANSYKKLLLIEESGTQTIQLDENLERLTIYCQDLIVQMADKKFMKIEDLVGLKKSERYGKCLKRMLSLVRECLDCRKNGVELSDDLKTKYTLTFGNRPREEWPENCNEKLSALDQDFVNNLLKKVTDISVNIYLDWASIEETDNSELTLQKSIGIDCYNFIEFARNYESIGKMNSLMEFLQQMSSKPEASTRRDIVDLGKKASAGSLECVKELFSRQGEWNDDVFAIIRENHWKLDKADFSNLLEYLTRVMDRTGNEEHKQQAYTTVTRVLLQQDLKDLYEVVLNYIIKHDGKNHLESQHTEETFEKFMSHNKNFKSPQNLRMLLFYLLKNPRKMLRILLKMSIDQGKYENVLITPSDLLLLSPIMNIREKAQESLLLGAFSYLTRENVVWNTKKMSHLVQVILEESLISADDFVNKIFAPGLWKTEIPLSNVRSILNSLRKIAPLCTKECRVDELMSAIGWKMSQIRDDKNIAKHSINEVIGMMKRVIEIYSANIENWLSTDEKSRLVGILLSTLKPIDKLYFEGLLVDGKMHIYDVIMDYERKCFLAINRIQADRRMSENNMDQKSDIDFRNFHDDFLRHLLVKSTQSEYIRFGTEATIFQWDNFRCKNEYEAYRKIVVATREACVYCLEFPGNNPPHTFPSLLKELAQFARILRNLVEIRDTRKIYEILKDNLSLLEKTVVETPFGDFYKNLAVEMNNRPRGEKIDDSLAELAKMIDHFANNCLDISHDDVIVNSAQRCPNEAARYKIAHDFITEFTRFDGVHHENYTSMCKIYKLLMRSDERVSTDL